MYTKRYLAKLGRYVRTGHVLRTTLEKIGYENMQEELLGIDLGKGI
jgi:hypothetical protein